MPIFTAQRCNQRFSNESIPAFGRCVLMLLLKQKGHRLKGVLPCVELACKAVLCVVVERCIMLSARRAPIGNYKLKREANGLLQ